MRSTIVSTSDRLSLGAVAATLLAGALLFTSSAMGEGGGTPIQDQGSDRRYQREAEDRGWISNYDRAYAQAHPGDPSTPNDAYRYRENPNRYRDDRGRYRDRSYYDRDYQPYYSDQSDLTRGLRSLFGF